MAFQLPALPYGKDALAPYLSAETQEYHYEKHHRAYVDNLNKLIAGGEFEHSTLEDIIKKATGQIFNNAAQVWNHNFYKSRHTPNTKAQPNGPVSVAIKKHFGSIDDFKILFT